MGMLEGKVAVITGAGRGIGRGEALLFAEEGARVVVNDLGGEWDGTGADPRAASQVVGEIAAAGGEAVAHFEDIGEPEGAASVVRLALDTWGRLDAVVNNAGLLRDRMVFNMSVEEWDAVIKVHLRGHFLVTHQACAHWREGAKAGIAAFSYIVGMEMERYGVCVNAIAPGARTRMTEKTFGDIAAPAAGEFDQLAPENVAPLVAFLCSDAAQGITGQVLGIQGGLVELYQGWHPVSSLHKDERWTPAELAGRMDELFGDRPRVYRPPASPFRRAAGLGGSGAGAAAEGS